MTPTEAYALMSFFFGTATVLSLMIIGGILIHTGKANWKLLGILGGTGLFLYVLVWYVNMTLNSRYIENLYEVCGRAG